MFRTIFSKLITIFILILVIAFSVTGVLLNIFLDNFVTNEKAKALEESSNRISINFNHYIENISNPLAEAYLNDTLAVYTNLTSSIIWIINDKGYIYRSSPELPQAIISKYTDNTGEMKLPDVKQFTRLITEGGSFKEIGDFSGFFKDPIFAKLKYEDLWLTFGKSFKYKNADGKEQTYAIYLHTPVPKVREARNSVFGYFLISVGFAVFISIILVYIFSLRLSRPLKQINNAARIIAGGEFKKRLNIKSRDEIGQLAGAFDQMAIALQNLEDMRRGFIANVSHELRTPMTSIRGFVEGILDGTIPPDRQGYYLTIVRDETNRLNRLVNDLLDLARMEAGEVSMNLKITDINELVRRCVIKLETLLVNKNIMVEADFEEEDMYVNADCDAIERVIYNLLHNSIKFTPENGKIKITTKVQKDKVIVSIEDNGRGMESSELDRIWERFYKSDKSRSLDKTGTGLGLAIVKNIINEHKQQIWVESESGKGTRFAFTLDRADMEAKIEE